MGKQKLTTKDVLEIKQALVDGAKHTDLGRIYGVSRECISKIYAGMVNEKSPNARWTDTPL
jgi:hypothetical protein